MKIEIIRDCCGIAAFAAIVVGCWWLHPAAGLIVGGALVLCGLICPKRNGNHGDS